MATTADIKDFCQAVNGGVLDGSESCRDGSWGWLSGSNSIEFPKTYISYVRYGYYVFSVSGIPMGQTADCDMWVKYNGVWVNKAHIHSSDGSGNASATDVNMNIDAVVEGIKAYASGWNGGVGYSSDIQAWGWKRGDALLV
jgi:hypothetical protein